MMNLIVNELNKNFFRKKNYIILLLLVLVSLLVGLIPLLSNNNSLKTYDKNNWQSQAVETIEKLSIENKNIIEKYENSKKNISLDSDLKLFDNTNEINRLQYHLDNDIQASAINNFYDNVTSISTLTIIISTFLIIIFSGIVSDEFSSGTIKMLLTRSYTRSEILFSKLVSIISAGIVYYLLTLVSLIIISLFTTKMNPTKYYVYLSSNEIYNSVPFIIYFIKLIFSNIFYITTIAIIIFFLSTITINTTITLGLGLLLIYVGPSIVSFLSTKTNLIKYFIISNWNLSNYLPGNHSSVEGLTFKFSIIISIVYFVLMIYIAFKVFNNRDIYS